jgi:cobalt-zinc-cadmium efflux system outer membrane protein
MLMLRSSLLLTQLVLGILTTIPPLQAQSLSGVRASTAGAGSPVIGGPSGSAFSQSPQIIGGPPGASVGRSPPRNFNPIPLPLQPPGPDQPRVTSPSAAPFEIFPRKNDRTPPLWLTGPSTGISLDEAIDRLIHQNLDLRARYSDMSQADADVLTANLRSNPIAYSDANGVPYGNYRRAAGPLQYDVNFVYPIDVSHKRQARTRSAVAARMVIEASYRDAVRLTIDLLYQAYVDALAAQVVIASHAVKGNVWSEIDVDEPQSALEQAQRSLALLINVSASDIHDRQLFGRLQFRPEEETHLYEAEALVRVALANRPDLQAQRLAVTFAEANINAVLANRFDDVLLLYQPYTFHDGRQGIPTNNSLSWTVGVTVPLPLYNRQQGNLLKARLAADQARTRLASLEKTVASEVDAAVLEHKTSHEALTRTWTDFDKFKNPPNLTSKRFNAILGPQLESTSWGDGSQVRRSGNNLVIVGTDNQGLIHIRIFDIGGNRVKDTDETAELRRRPSPDFSTLKKLLTDFSTLKKPTHAEKTQHDSDVISEVMSIVGTPEQKLNDELRLKLMDVDNRVRDLLDDRISDKLKTYWETLIRHRKSMLRLNTVTGVCLSP